MFFPCLNIENMTKIRKIKEIKPFSGNINRQGILIPVLLINRWVLVLKTVVDNYLF